MTDEILDAESVSQLLRCSTEQAEQLMRDGDLPATKIGRGWITTRSKVLQFVERRIGAPAAKREMKAIEARMAERGRRVPVPLPDVRG